MTILDLKKKKETGEKLVMVTCYDFWSARLIDSSPVDLVLIGDSAAMVMHGHQDTLPATIEMLKSHVEAVRRGCKKFLVADLPFLSFRGDLASNIEAVRALMQAGANAVKLEALDGNGELIRHLVESGVPVMGHTGLTPQFVNAFGGFRVQGRDQAAREKILGDAKGLEKAGAFSVVLECIPENLAGEVTAALSVPTIGIGAGPHCDGQVLVLQDLLGFNRDFKPRFVRQYLNGADLVGGALENFCADVRGGRFPDREEGFS